MSGRSRLVVVAALVAAGVAALVAATHTTPAPVKTPDVPAVTNPVGGVTVPAGAAGDRALDNELIPKVQALLAALPAGTPNGLVTKQLAQGLGRLSNPTVSLRALFDPLRVDVVSVNGHTRCVTATTVTPTRCV